MHHTQSPDAYYDRCLPHIQPAGATFFITYRLAGSIPIKLLKQWKEVLDEAKRRGKGKPDALATTYRRQFLLMDRYLDKDANGPYWLSKPFISKEVANSLHHLNEKRYRLWAYCIMPNHVHVLLTHQDTKWPLYKILQSHKSYTAKICNRLLERSGPFWEKEYYDHIVRNPSAFSNILNYILQNPVKAGLTRNWKEWPYTWCCETLLKLNLIFST